VARRPGRQPPQPLIPPHWGVVGADEKCGKGAGCRGRSALETLLLGCEVCAKGQPDPLTDSIDENAEWQAHLRMVVEQNSGARIQVTICGRCSHTTKVVLPD